MQPGAKHLSGPPCLLQSPRFTEKELQASVEQSFWSFPDGSARYWALSIFFPPFLTVSTTTGSPPATFPLPPLIVGGETEVGDAAFFVFFRFLRDDAPAVAAATVLPLLRGATYSIPLDPCKKHNPADAGCTEGGDDERLAAWVDTAPDGSQARKGESSPAHHDFDREEKNRGDYFQTVLC